MVQLKKVMTLLIILYFVFRTHGIVQSYPAVWVIPLLGIIIGALFLTSRLNFRSIKFLFKESKWIILSVFILLGYMYFDYGNFKLYITFNFLITSIPFYLIGFYFGAHNHVKILKRITISYFIFLSVFLLPKIITVLSSGRFDDYMFNSLFVSDKDDRDFIQFLPFVAFVTTLGFFYLRKIKTKKAQFFSILFFGINLFALFLSGKATAIALLMFTIIIFFISKSKNTIKQIGYALPAFSFVLIMVFFIGSGLFGDLGSLKAKSSALLLLFDTGFIFKEEILDQITSQRWTAGIYSVQQFLNEPFFGNGAYLESVKGMLGNVRNFTTASGGHSFVLDTLAFYGIFGFPIILIYFKFAKDAFRYRKIVIQIKNENKIALLFAALMASIFILNILNSFLLFSPFDNFIFLSSGFFLGKYYFNTTIYE